MSVPIQSSAAAQDAEGLLNAYLQLALCLRRAREYRQAAQVVRWAVKRFPAAAPAHVSLGLLYLDQGKYREAQGAFGCAIGTAPRTDAETRLAAYMGSARAYRAEGQHSQAVPCLRRAMECGPPTPEILVMLADSLVESGDLVNAADVLSRVPEDAPEFASVTEQRAGLLARLGLLDDARATYDRAIKYFSSGAAERPVQRQLLVAKAGLLREAGEYALAAATVAEVLAQDSRNVAALVEQALILRDRGAFMDALSVMDSVPTDGATPSVQCLLIRAELLLGLQRFDDAMEVIDRVVELAPETPHSYVLRASVAFWEERFDDVLSDLDLALARGMDASFDVHQRRGEALAMLGRYEEAAAAFTAALAVEPRDAQTWVYRGEMFRQIGRHDTAVEDLDAALALDPESSLALCLRGDLRRDRGDYGGALEDFERADALAPGDPWTISRRGEVYRLLGRFEVAIRDFDQALAIDPDDAWIVGSRGEAYLAVEDFDRARQDLERACSLSPCYYWVVAARGELNLLTGRYEDALHDLERASADQEVDWYVFLRGLAKLKLGITSSAVLDIRRAREIALARDCEGVVRDQRDLAAALFLVPLNSCSDAVEEYRAVLQRRPEGAVIREALRDIRNLGTLGFTCPESSAPIRELLETTLMAPQATEAELVH